MGFWDEYKENTGQFIGEAEKDKLIDGKVPLQVLSVRHVVTNFPVMVGDPERPGKEMPLRDANGNLVYKEQFVVSVELNGETRQLGFGTGIQTRDELLRDMIEYSEKNGADADLPRIYIERAGRAKLVRLYRDEANAF